MSMTADPSILPLVIAWPVLLAVVTVNLWRRSERGIGLVVLYLALFSAFHWTAPAIQLLPWYTPMRDPTITQIGFNYSFIGLLSFLVGAVVIGPFLLDFARVQRVSEAESGEAEKVEVEVQQPSSTAVYYFVFGVVSYFLITPFSSVIPSLAAFSTSSVKLIFVGVMLLYYKISQGKSSLPRWLVLIPVAVWPLVTITNEGFLGFGLAGPLVVCLFIIFTRKAPLRPQHLLLGILITYFMLSITSTYMSTRTAIRGSIAQGSGIVDRLGSVYDSLVAKFALFDLTDPDRTEFIEDRLDMSYLAGAAIDRLNSGVVDFSHGETLVDSALSLIPRAVWPDKPFIVGGSALVTEYTGIQFADNTTVAAGQVMELYINFGVFGLVAGFGILGVILSLLDLGAGRALQRGDSFRFALMVIPAFGILLIGDNLLEIVGSAVSGVVTGIIVNAAIRMVDSLNSGKDAAPPAISSQASLKPGNHR